MLTKCFTEYMVMFVVDIEKLGFFYRLIFLTTPMAKQRLVEASHIAFQRNLWKGVWDTR
jgi:hypothetical protein